MYFRFINPVVPCHRKGTHMNAVSTESLQVYPAEPYRICALGARGNAVEMLIRQYKFPDTYSSKDVLLSTFSDHLLGDFEHADRCFREHTSTSLSGFGIEDWALHAAHKRIFAFLIDAFRADQSVNWTGYRICGSVHEVNGHAIFHLELFAKHPQSDTRIYTGANAPNVLSSPRRTSSST